jgi:hypothetical protein
MFFLDTITENLQTEHQVGIIANNTNRKKAI